MIEPLCRLGWVGKSGSRVYLILMLTSWQLGFFFFMPCRYIHTIPVLPGHWIVVVPILSHSKRVPINPIITSDRNQITFSGS